MEWTVVKKISTPDFDIEAGAAKIGEDILLYIQGGDKPHIGCTVMAVPRPSLSGNGERSVTSSVMNPTGHKDENICRMLAEDVCRTCGKTVVCTGGVHLENITAEQINEVRIAAEQLEEMLISELN